MYVVEGYRTPFCKFNTDLSDEPPAHLGISPSKHILSSVGLSPEYIDEVIFGCCNQPADELGNIARTIALRTGVPEAVPAVTVHRNCASGFEAITYACDKAHAGKGDVFLVGGVESMSRAPFIYSRDAVKKFTNLSKSRTLMSKLRNVFKFRPSDFSPLVSLKLGMTDTVCGLNMGQTAEVLAREYGVTRRAQDEFAESSHLRALANSDKTESEIAPFNCTEDNCIRSFSNKTLYQDNGPRNDSFVDKLSKLKPVFDREGSVTAGNSSQVTDGGAALLLMTDAGLEKTGCTPIAEIIDYAYAGCDPSRMGLGPVHAIDKLSQNRTFDLREMDLIEINEAFAAQVLACKNHLSIPDDKLNVNGGAIAIGHPLAATGTRLVLTLAKQLKSKQLSHGLASLCIGGGQGGAIWIKAL
jgi:acetyl-CoA C-acetyltransferase/acetyl-CoA acyltransferase